MVTTNRPCFTSNPPTLSSKDDLPSIAVQQPVPTATPNSGSPEGSRSTPLDAHETGDGGVVPSDTAVGGREPPSDDVAEGTVTRKQTLGKRKKAQVQRPSRSPKNLRSRLKVQVISAEYVTQASCR